jgi:meso-butanediol dehydrogenase/(S,S)-butanediol dehydrogenase/diacetyl reductase
MAVVEGRQAGRVVIVSGAAAGIGRATAERLAREGASLYLVDVQAEGLEETRKLCVELGADVQADRCDVSDEADVQRNVDACVARFGRIDALCNIAGILLLDHFESITAERFKRVLDVNVVGTFLMAQKAMPHLIASKGAIVNISSTSALAGMPYGAAYGTSKGAVSALTRTLAVEFGKRGVRCNAINPGSILTAMSGPNVLPEDADMQLVARAQPLDKPRGPEVIAAVVALLVSEDGIHVNGEEIRVDGGTLA